MSTASYDPPRHSIDAILSGDRFAMLFAQARAAHPLESDGSNARWAFIRLQGWDRFTTWEERFSAPRLSIAQKNALGHAYSRFSGVELTPTADEWGALDYGRAYAAEAGDRAAAVLPSLASFEFFARNAKWIVPAGVILYFAPQIAKAFKTVKS